MGLVPGVTGPHLVDGRVLCREHDLVDGALHRTETAIHWKRAGDVAGVLLVFRARVDEHQIAVVQDLAVRGVMEDAAVDTAAHDARIGRGAAAALGEGVQQHGLERVLVEPRPAGAHGAAVGLGRERGRLAHELDLRGDLAQAHLVNRAR